MSAGRTPNRRALFQKKLNYQTDRQTDKERTKAGTWRKKRKDAGKRKRKKSIWDFQFCGKVIAETKLFGIILSVIFFQ
jgi:hypothetical protein